MEIKSISEQWKEMEGLYEIAGWKAVKIIMRDYVKDIHSLMGDKNVRGGKEKIELQGETNE